jgi:hypothetical protein
MIECNVLQLLFFLLKFYTLDKNVCSYLGVEMKENNPRELEDFINEKIYLGLEVHILTKRLNRSTLHKNEKLIIYFEKRRVRLLDV